MYGYTEDIMIANKGDTSSEFGGHELVPRGKSGDDGKKEKFAKLMTKAQSENKCKNKERIKM